MKILYIIDSLGTGGAERDLVETLSMARAHGITPIVASLRHRAEGVQDEVLRLGIDVRFIRASNLLTRALEVRSLIRAERPDLVHTVLAQSDVVGRLAASGTRTAILTSAVGTSHERPLDGTLRAKLFHTLDRWTARHLLTHVHANSKAVRAHVQHRLGVPARRITTIENGRDPVRLGEVTARRRRAARERLGLTEQHDVLVNAARQDYVKGQPFLVDAFATLSRARPNLVLLIAGRRGEMSAVLDDLHARSGVGDRLRMLGHRDDVPEILAAADIFVFPSLHEGMPGAVIEAMALGLPIVASRLPEIEELVEHERSAVLVEPRSPPALASAIARLLDDRETAHELGHRARQRFSEHFTLEQSMRRRVALYRTLCVAR